MLITMCDLQNMSRMAGLRQNDHWCAALSLEEMTVLDVRDRFMTPLKHKLDLAENFDEFEPDEQERLNRKFPELVSLHEMLQAPTFVADKHYISGKSVAEWQLLAFERSLSGNIIRSSVMLGTHSQRPMRFLMRYLPRQFVRTWRRDTDTCSICT